MDDLAPIFEKLRQGDSFAVSTLIKTTQKTVVGRLFLYFRRYNFNNPFRESDFLTKTYVEDCISDVYAETVMNLHHISKSSNRTRYFWGIVHNVLIDCLKKRYRYLHSHAPISGGDDGGNQVGIHIPSDEDIPTKTYYKLRMEKIITAIDGMDNSLTQDLLFLLCKGYKPREILALLHDQYSEEKLNKDNVYSKIRCALNLLTELLQRKQTAEGQFSTN